MSPDLNPIEHVWNHLKRQVEMRQPSNLHELKDVVATIEIINNTRGGIEGRIGERGVWGANSSMFTHSRCPRQKKSF